MCHNAGILSQTPRKNFSLLVARVLLRHFITIKFILVFFALLWFFYLFFRRGGGVIAFALLSVHKSAMELRSLHRDSKSNYFFVFQSVKTTKYWEMPTEKWQTTLRLSFATTLLGLHGFVSKETQEQKCPLHASHLTNAGHTPRDG